ncbi:MAG: thioredoxin-disulfide reductase [Thermoguttaceae bacterium]|nr:thioredoxin-disulfide reductase [Thermoguttaceae bacterium]
MSSDQSIEEVIIIGSGPAGWTAGIYTARADLNPVLFEGALSMENQEAGTLPMGQLAQTTEVENYPGFPSGQLDQYLETALTADRFGMLIPGENMITGPGLVELMRQQAINFGTRIVSADIVSVDFQVRPFRLTDSEGKVWQARSVIVATGASANYLHLESETRFKNFGVSACAVCDGALPRFRNHPVAVIGGGDSAVEEAGYLSRFASSVYIVHRRDQLRASQAMVRRIAENPRIKILWNRIPEEILGNDSDGVTGIRLRSTVQEDPMTLDVSGVFLAIGHTPNTGFLAGQLELTEKGFIKRPVPFRTNTSVPGVFTAGDVADDHYQQAITAAGTGCMAALDVGHYLASLDTETK